MASNTINTFIDFNTLNAQSAGQEYGPISNTQFRVSSVFTLSADSMAADWVVANRFEFDL